MKPLHQVAALCAFLGLFFVAMAAIAADAPQQPPNPRDRDKVCTACHDQNQDKPILSIYQTRHGVAADPRTPGCQSCHGRSEEHIKSVGRVQPEVVFGTKQDPAHHASTPEAQTEACLTCHKSGNRTYWSGSQHQFRELVCSNCQSVHTPNDPVLTKVTQSEVCFACHKTQRAQIHYFSTHPILVGKTACSDCHNPHGSTAPKLLVKDTVNETCYTCHAEKRGPFLWEHSSVVDDCTNCHTPHGSTKPPLLKARVPWLCQSCHTGDHGAQVNSGANLPGGAATTLNGQQGLANQSPRAQTNARACLNCHVLIHGSNHPAGAKFQR